jgi:hypothetical protein
MYYLVYEFDVIDMTLVERLIMMECVFGLKNLKCLTCLGFGCIVIG